MLADLAHLTHSAHSPLVLWQILGAVERALLERSTSVNRRVAGSADVKLGKLVEFNLDGVVGIAFVLGLVPFGLQDFC